MHSLRLLTAFEQLVSFQGLCVALPSARLPPTPVVDVGECVPRSLGQGGITSVARLEC